MPKIIIASNNSGKIKEFEQLLAPLKWQFVSQAELSIPAIPETGLTFIENAILKARHACQISGLPALADDSGLVVDALAGRPGIYSARYAGEGASAQASIEKVLAELKEIPDEKRTAHFYCILVYLRHAADPAPLIAEGRWNGRILPKPRGEKGFGYDPIFWVPEHNCSAAELAPALKNQLSHRGKALSQLINVISLKK